VIALSGGFFPAARAAIRPERERNGLVAGKGPALSVGQGRISADSASAGSNPAPPANVRASNKRFPPCCGGKGRKPEKGEFPCSTFSSGGQTAFIRGLVERAAVGGHEPREVPRPRTVARYRRVRAVAVVPRRSGQRIGKP